jgi:hypothetical protein
MFLYSNENNLRSVSPAAATISGNVYIKSYDDLQTCQNSAWREHHHFYLLLQRLSSLARSVLRHQPVFFVALLDHVSLTADHICKLLGSPF